jgi:threonine/homoserine/homoserine lactone efflux protein
LTQLIPNPVVVPVGLLIGVLVSAPVGPVNVLCISRAIERGFWGGVAAGLGAVLSDGLIASIAVLGVGTISRTIQQYRDAIQFMGGVAVIAFGIRLLKTSPQAEVDHPSKGRPPMWQDYF